MFKLHRQWLILLVFGRAPLACFHPDEEALQRKQPDQPKDHIDNRLPAAMPMADDIWGVARDHDAVDQQGDKQADNAKRYSPGGFFAHRHSLLVQSVNSGRGHNRIERYVVRFDGEALTQLHIPCEANGHAARMFREPAIIMAAALAQTVTFGGETDQGDEQNFGDDRGCIGGWLAEVEGAGDKVAFAERVAVLAEGHRSVGGAEMRERDGVAGLVEVFGIAACGSFGSGGVVKSDARLRADLGEQRGRGVVKQKPANTVRLGRNMIAAGLAQLCAEG